MGAREDLLDIFSTSLEGADATFRAAFERFVVIGLSQEDPFKKVIVDGKETIFIKKWIIENWDDFYSTFIDNGIELGSSQFTLRREQAEQTTGNKMPEMKVDADKIADSFKNKQQNKYFAAALILQAINGIRSFDKVVGIFTENYINGIRGVVEDLGHADKRARRVNINTQAGACKYCQTQAADINRGGGIWLTREIKFHENCRCTISWQYKGEKPVKIKGEEEILKEIRVAEKVIKNNTPTRQVVAGGQEWNDLMEDRIANNMTSDWGKVRQFLSEARTGNISTEMKEFIKEEFDDTLENIMKPIEIKMTEPTLKNIVSIISKDQN